MFSTFFLNAVILWAQGQEEKTSPAWAPFLPIFGMLALLYFLFILPMRRREQQQKQNVQNALKKNARVVTVSGIIGTVAAVHENGDISLKVDDSSPLKLRMTKGSIVQVLSDEAGKEAPGKAAADASPAVKS